MRRFEITFLSGDVMHIDRDWLRERLEQVPADAALADGAAYLESCLVGQWLDLAGDPIDACRAASAILRQLAWRELRTAPDDASGDSIASAAGLLHQLERCDVLLGTPDYDAYDMHGSELSFDRERVMQRWNLEPLIVAGQRECPVNLDSELRGVDTRLAWALINHPVDVRRTAAIGALYGEMLRQRFGGVWITIDIGPDEPRERPGIMLGNRDGFVLPFDVCHQVTRDPSAARWMRWGSIAQILNDAAAQEGFFLLHLLGEFRHRYETEIARWMQSIEAGTCS